MSFFELMLAFKFQLLCLLQEHQFVHMHFSGLALVAFFVFPLVIGEPAFDGNFLALAHIFFNDIHHFAKGYNIVPVGGFHALAFNEK